jgi:hypothetical protein
MLGRRILPAVLLGVLALTTTGCGHAGCDSQNPASAGSCAGDIAIAGVQYIAGRGDGAPPVPHTGRELHGTLLPCADGCTPSAPVLAHSIPGVPVADAVAGPVGYQLMLAERLWQKPRSALPAAVRPYVRP